MGTDAGRLTVRRRYWSGERVRTNGAGVTPLSHVVLAGVVLLCSALVRTSGASQVPPDSATSIGRAVGYLATEVPRWRREHPCYSCHNNGDGTRALMVAAGRGLIDIQQVNDAAAWVRSPDRWSRNSQDGGVKDESLSRIQFASALRALVDVGGAGRASLERAADLVADAQRSDGAWAISATSNVGTPTGYGTPLATAMARRLLVVARTPRSQDAAVKADAWFRQFEPQAVLEASAVVLGLSDATDVGALRRREQALALLKQGQGDDGGWGPYLTAPSEPFDTAVAMLALSDLRMRPALAAPVFTDRERLAAIARGRAYLLAQQMSDGSWLETTRPSGQESYSQRISTTAWALDALLAD